MVLITLFAMKTWRRDVEVLSGSIPGPVAMHSAVFNYSLRQEILLRMNKLVKGFLARIRQKQRN